MVRGLSKGYPPPLPFVLVSLAATGVLTIGWRTAFAKFGPGVRPIAQHCCLLM